MSLQQLPISKLEWSSAIGTTVILAQLKTHSYHFSIDKSNNKKFLGHFHLEMFYLHSTLDFGILPVLIIQLEVYWKVDRLLTGLTALQIGTTAQWYSNKTSTSPSDTQTILNRTTQLP